MQVEALEAAGGQSLGQVQSPALLQRWQIARSVPSEWRMRGSRGGKGRRGRGGDVKPDAASIMALDLAQLSFSGLGPGLH